MAEVAELAGGAVEQVQAVERADPEAAVAVFQHRAHDVVGQARGRGRVVLVRGLLAVRVDAVQAAAGRGPQGAVARDVHVAHVVGIDVGGGEYAPREAFRLRIEVREAVARADPHGAVAAERHRRRHRVARQPRFDGGQAPCLVRAGRRIEQVQAAVRGQPQAAAALADDAAHLVVFQRERRVVAAHDARETAAAHVRARHAAVPRADPERAHAVAVQRRDLVVAQAVAVGDAVRMALEAAQRGQPAVQAAVVRADPHLALGILVEHADLARRHAVVRAERAHLALRPERQAFQAAHAADPQALARVDHQRLHEVVLAAARRRVVAEVHPLGIEAVEARRGADPQAAVAPAREGRQLVGREAVRHAGHVVPCLEAAGRDVEVLQAVGRREPQPVLAVVQDGADVAVAVAPLGRFVRQEMGERARLRFVAIEAAVRADPQAALAVDEQHAHPVVGERLRIADDVAEIREAVAVVARQAGLGAEPHEAVRVLDDGQHGFLRQAVVHRQVLEAQGRRRRRVDDDGPQQREHQEQASFHASKNSSTSARRA